MTARSEQGNRPPTRISLRDLRADDLERLIRSPRGRAILTLDDIEGMSELFTWPREIVRTAIADLVADGRLHDLPCGRLELDLDNAVKRK